LRFIRDICKLLSQHVNKFYFGIVQVQIHLDDIILLTLPQVYTLWMFSSSEIRLIGQHTSSSFLAFNSRLRSAICRHHPPQRAVLSQICCFGERKVVLFQILLDGAEPRNAGTTYIRHVFKFVYLLTYLLSSL